MLSVYSQVMEDKINLGSEHQASKNNISVLRWEFLLSFFKKQSVDIPLRFIN